MKKIIIYGAGKRGKWYFDLFTKYGLKDMIYGYCDKRFEMVTHIDTSCVYSYDQVKDKNIPFLISVSDKEQKSQIMTMLINNGNEIIEIDDLCSFFGYNDRVEFNRMLCASYHQEYMDSYFTDSENTLNLFWDDTSAFKSLFEKLNCDNIIELACGRGRHVQMYMDKAKSITLVDILDKNIELCRERFKDQDKIKYYCNNGFNLEELQSSHYSALFSYDSMVHFEMMDIYSYLKDIYRVLIPGGRALIHHSNNNSDYKASFANSPHGRAFMSKDIFAYFAYKCGFKIIAQKEIDWGIKNLDCLTLLEK